MAKVRDETIALMRRLGLTTVFGNPGSTELPLFQNFPDDFRYVLALQEASAVGIAEGFAAARGRPALVNLHTAPGVGNAMGNLIAAYHHKVPLVVTAGQQVRATALMEPFLYNLEAASLPRPYVKWSYEPVRAADVPRALLRAYLLAMSPPRGPVFLSIPMDDWEAEGDPVAVRRVSFELGPEDGAVQALAADLQRSRAPAIVAGPGVGRENAHPALVELAERLGAKVWASPVAHRDCFPEDHGLFQGHLPPAQKLISQCLIGHDQILVAGAPVFSYYPHLPGPVIPEGARLTQLTDDPAEVARAPLGDAILGSVRLTLERLLEAIPARQVSFPGRKADPPPPNERGPLSAAQVYAACASLLPADAIVLFEAPSTLPALRRYIRITSERRYFTCGSGGLGYAMPAAVGVQMAEPGRKVVCFIGDGSSLYSPQAIWTAVQCRAPVVFVVLNNSEYGVLKAFARMEKMGAAMPGLDLPGLDLVAMARAFGCAASRAESVEDVRARFSEALGAAVPSLLDVTIRKETAPLL